jgi:hypothetical protein
MERTYDILELATAVEISSQNEQCKAKYNLEVFTLNSTLKQRDCHNRIILCCWIVLQQASYESNELLRH